MSQSEPINPPPVPRTSVEIDLGSACFVCGTFGCDGLRRLWALSHLVSWPALHMCFAVDAPVWLCDDCAMRQLDGAVADAFRRAIDEDSRPWCSSIESDEEHVYGPAKSREAAIQLAQDSVNDDDRGDSECIVGRCEYADPGEHCLLSDIDLLVEEVDQRAAENGFCFADGEVFKFRKDDSDSALLDDVRAALRKHMHSRYFMMDGDGREVVPLEPSDESKKS